MLKNGRVTAFTVSKLLKENQQKGGGGGKTTIFRSSHWRCYVKKSALKYFAKFTGKHSETDRNFRQIKKNCENLSGKKRRQLEKIHLLRAKSIYSWMSIL